jgi:TRAP transporter TAXI family solute receptor
MGVSISRLWVVWMVAAGLSLVGCGERQTFLSLGTAPVGGVFPVVGGALCEVLNEYQDPNKPAAQRWLAQARGTKGTQENIRRLASGEFELGMANAAIVYYAVRPEKGRAAGWERGYDIRAVMTLAPNVCVFITKADSGIRTFADLRGKRVVIGPAGAGFEMFARPLLEQHGVGWGEITVVNATQSGAVELLADGAADVAFLGGAIPASAVQQACSSFDAYFIPYDDAVLDRLFQDTENYPFFQPIPPIPNLPRERWGKIPAGTYPGQTEDFRALNVGSMILVTHQRQPDELIYEITKTIYQAQVYPREGQVGAVELRHPAGRAINPRNAWRYAGVPFHPGAVKFYAEERQRLVEQDPQNERLLPPLPPTQHE